MSSAREPADTATAPPMPDISPEAREAIAADPEMTRVAERLHEIFSAADLEAVDAAITAGDPEGIAEAMGVSVEELTELGETLTTSAQQYAERFPELADLAAPPVAPPPGVTAPEHEGPANA